MFGTQVVFDFVLMEPNKIAEFTDVCQQPLFFELRLRDGFEILYTVTLAVRGFAGKFSFAMIAFERVITGMPCHMVYPKQFIHTAVDVAKIAKLLVDISGMSFCFPRF